MGGPWSVPCPRSPWQVEHRSSYSAWPWSSCGWNSAVSVAGSATPGADVSGRNANTPGSASSANTTSCARANRGRFMGGASSDHEDRREQPDPHDVDEVPVVRGDLHAGVLVGRVRAGRGPAEDHEH